MQPQPSPKLIEEGFFSRVVLPDGGKGRVMIVGEAPGRLEDETGIPFHPEAEAGGLLARLLARVGLKREQFTLTNCVWQRPPRNELYDDDGYPMPYTREAIAHWKPFLHKAIEEFSPPVVIGLGRTALEVLTGFSDITTSRGYVHWGRIGLDKPDEDFNEMWDRRDLHLPVLCTYHPQFLNYGNRYLSGVFLRDILEALEISREGWNAPKLKVVATPTAEEFRWFCGQYNPERHVLTYDIENPETRGVGEDTIENEFGKKEISYEIDRMSFCFDAEAGGWSIPYTEPFIGMAKGLLASSGRKRGHNCRLHDRPRLVHNGFVVGGREEDTLELWRHLHRTLPASVAYIAPFYLRISPWKHEAHTQPEWYSAMDAVCQHHIGEGIERDLRRSGQWEVAQRHVVEILALAEQMGRNGLPYDREKAKAFEAELVVKERERLARLQELVPDELKPVKQKEGLTRAPKELVGDASPQTVEVVVKAGKRKGEIELHTYVKREFTLWVKGDLGTLPERVVRWARLEEFNPNSPVQVKLLIRHFGHKAKTDRKTRKETSGDDTLRGLINKWTDNARHEMAIECYRLIRECRAISKVLGTYVKGWRPGEDGAIHATPGIWGDMFRISWRRPNLAATVADKKEIQIAAGFRECIAVDDSHVIVECDWKGMESVIVAHLAGDEQYMRLARLSPHAYLASHLLERPADLAWNDDDLGAYLKEIKSSDEPRVVKVYDDAKHTVHGISYGMTPFLMAELYEMTRARAAYLQDMFFEVVAPKVRQWQQGVMQEAYDRCKLVNPWGYHLATWDVFVWNQKRYDRLRQLWVRYRTRGVEALSNRELKEVAGIENDAQLRSLCFDLGDGAKATLAFYPRDIGAAMLKDAMLALRDEYEFASWGRVCTHDAILGIDTRDRGDFMAEAMLAVMQRPQPLLGGLVIEAEPKIGRTWSKKGMHEWEPAVALA